MASLEPRINSDALERELAVRRMERDVEELERLRKLDEARRREEAERQRRQLEQAPLPAPVPMAPAPAPGDAGVDDGGRGYGQACRRSGSENGMPRA